MAESGGPKTAWLEAAVKKTPYLKYIAAGCAIVAVVVAVVVVVVAVVVVAVAVGTSSNGEV